MKVLSAAEMQVCDRATAERYGRPTIELMRAASRALAEYARSQFPRVRRVTVLAGRGNNGGDGLMAARLLAAAGLEVSTILLGPAVRFAADAAQAWEELLASADPLSIHVVEKPEDLTSLEPLFRADLLIDALLGTGFKPPMRGLALDLLRFVENSPAKILSVDLPSGWPADSTAAASEGVFPSDAVLTFTAPKPAHLFGHLTRSVGDPVAVAPIGSPEAAMVSSLDLGWTGSSLELVQRQRAVEANKGRFGHVLVVGGCSGSEGGRVGAPLMASLAALRAGAGLVTAAIPAPALALAASAALELMSWPLEVSAAGGVTAANLAPERLARLLAGKTVLVAGPGLGQRPEAAEFLAGLLAAADLPTILDADALNLIAAEPGLLPKSRKSRLIVTPHPGEMARLMGTSVAEIQANRLQAARALAERLQATVVLKGARTVIAHPKGRAAVNTTGNPAMAKGGSGDVLAGLIGGLLAQYPTEPERAVEAAVYLHGLAADLALSRGDQHTLLATDSFRFLARAFAQNPFAHFHPEAPSGYVCLAGKSARRRSHSAHAHSPSAQELA